MGKNTFSAHLAEYLTEYTHTEDISALVSTSIYLPLIIKTAGLGGHMGQKTLGYTELSWCWCSDRHDHKIYEENTDEGEMGG